MIKVRFVIGENRLVGFEISGHSMFAECGSDIVCAAVSSAAIMTANTVTDVISADAQADVHEGYLRLILNSPDENAEKVLEGFKIHMTGLSKQYPQNIKIIYGGVKNA